MTQFQKISPEQFRKDRLPGLLDSGLTESAALEELQQEYGRIELPRRGTAFSAGYDLRIPYDLELAPGESTVVMTGLRICMPGNLWLGIYIRSSLGFKYNVRLKNSVAVIDADYYGADNEGHLMIGLYNGGDRTLVLHAGDAIAQGILQPYYLTDDDRPVREHRSGGIGSTGK